MRKDQPTIWLRWHLLPDEVIDLLLPIYPDNHTTAAPVCLFLDISAAVHPANEIVVYCLENTPVTD